jgi:hypothetical protein
MGRTFRNSSTNVRVPDQHRNDALTTNSTEILVPYPRCTIAGRSLKPHSRSRRQEVL